MTFPERVYKLRKERNLTQEQVASEAGLVLRSYRRYEAGEREPTMSTLVQLANFYHVTIDYLVGRSDQRN